MLRVLSICAISVCLAVLVARECNCEAGCARNPLAKCQSCEVGWDGPYCQRKNVALDGTATQKDTYYHELTNKSYGAELAVDGNTDTEFYNGSCTHTNWRNNSWWSVQLGDNGVNQIRYMKIYNRNESEKNVWRRKGMGISIDGKRCKKWPDIEIPETIEDVNCSETLSGNNLTITVLGQFFSLCEVQVFVCSDGWFGKDCDKRCKCLDSDEVCDKVTGRCKRGCRAGYIGDDCQTRHCVNNQPCNKTNGHCPDACEEWWNGTKCGVCRDGRYGLNCSNECGHCVDNQACNKSTGHCPGACEDRWGGTKCDMCRDGRYEQDCSEECGHCVDNQACNKSTGHCPGACVDGWKKPKCDMCRDGRYGQDCSKECGHCVDNLACDKSTGHCPGGCKDGWSGKKCDVCSDGRYMHMHGHICITCGHCANNQTCHKTSGHCPGACADGYNGKKCNIANSASLISKDNLPAVVAGVVLLLVILTIVFIVMWFKRRRERSAPGTLNKAYLGNTEIDAEKQDEEDGSDEDNKEDDEEVYAVETYVDDTYANATTCTDFVPSKVSLEKLQQYNRQMTAKKGFKIEYKLIPYGINGVVDIGKLPENKIKNRFAALYPYDHSRVLLDGASDYINASYIAGWTEEKRYIATQGPTPVTIKDLWRMVWQKDMDKIVMVTNLKEMNKRKCEQYWPDENKEEVYGDFTVLNTGTISRANFDITSLVFWRERKQESRRLTHFHFTAWPDHDVPSAPALVTFWKKVKQVDRGERRPLVVHCSAGVGRTGTFIALDYLMEQAKNTGKVCVFECVAKQREARMNMIQTVNQYEFVHHAVLEAIQCTHTFHTIEQFTETFGTAQSYTSKQDDAFKKEFKSLQALRRDITEEEASDALLPENKNKNKDRKILPANNSRPFLSTLGPGSNNYINAVYLTAYQSRSKLIVTQTPMTSTVVDFWSLVYDHDCSTIVCLDDAMDGIYPSDGRPLSTGPFRVEQSGVRPEGCFMEKKLMLRNTRRGSPPATITLLHFTKLRESRSVSSYLEFARRVDDLVSKTEDKLLIHCSDGATLCGLFSSVLNTVSRLRLDSELDIYLAVRELQLVRPNFINALAQYKFCYDIVKEFIRSDSIYSNT